VVLVLPFELGVGLPTVLYQIFPKGLSIVKNPAIGNPRARPRAAVAARRSGWSNIVKVTSALNAVTAVSRHTPRAA
jgi:hypothetical protein